MADNVRYFERFGKLFRMSGSAQERFDPASNAWVDVSPDFGDLVHDLDTDTNEINEKIAKRLAPQAFEGEAA